VWRQRQRVTVTVLFSTAISCIRTLAGEQKFLAGAPLFPVGSQYGSIS